MPIPFLDDQGCFQLVLERNQDDLHETEEIIEYFDGTRNMGRSETQLGPLKILTFSFYDTNELFTIDPSTYTLLIGNTTTLIEITYSYLHFVRSDYKMATAKLKI